MNCRILFLASTFIGLSAFTFVACSEDAASKDAGADASKYDAGDPEDEDGGEITDSGDIQDDPDAADDDAGADTGACDPMTLPPATTSICSSTQASYTGGTIVPGNYVLERAIVRATKTSCATNFKAAEFASRIDVSKNGADFLIKFVRVVTRDGGTINSARYDVDTVRQGKLLVLTPKDPCVGTAGKREADYASYVNTTDKKQRLLISFPYGKTGTASYRYVLP